MRTDRANAGLFCTYCVFGALVFVGAKLGLPYMPPLAFAALRLDVAGVVLVARPDPANLLTPCVLGVAVMVSSVPVFALGSVLTQRLDPALSRVTMAALGAVLAKVALGFAIIAAGFALVEHRLLFG